MFPAPYNYIVNRDHAVQALRSRDAEIAALKAEVERLTNRHCDDCCCARSWEALGGQTRKGASIVEHIEMLRAEIEQVRGAWLDPCQRYEVDAPCDRCGGLGRRAYPSTATWMYGIGGQMVTTGTCDRCWGTGEAHRTGFDLRRVMRLLALLREVAGSGVEWEATTSRYVTVQIANVTWAEIRALAGEGEGKT